VVKTTLEASTLFLAEVKGCSGNPFYAQERSIKRLLHYDFILILVFSEFHLQQKI
jgi:hypothetical protein